ncbi:MAG TPA: flagellar assembly protein FliX [Beijerinckiaceae bacterium]|jgi:hypothetical protein
MHVDPKANLVPLAVVSRRPEASGRGFALDGQAGAARAGGTAAAAPLATLDALLALQGEDDPAERRRRATRRGHDLLDGLDRLKAALLSGQIPGAELTALAGRLREASAASGDPKLDDLLGQIELRAQVELAKLGRAV